MLHIKKKNLERKENKVRKILKERKEKVFFFFFLLTRMLAVTSHRAVGEIFLRSYHLNWDLNDEKEYVQRPRGIVSLVPSRSRKRARCLWKGGGGCWEETGAVSQTWIAWGLKDRVKKCEFLGACRGWSSQVRGRRAGLGGLPVSLQPYCARAG